MKCTDCKRWASSSCKVCLTDNRDRYLSVALYSWNVNDLVNTYSYLQKFVVKNTVLDYAFRIIIHVLEDRQFSVEYVSNKTGALLNKFNTNCDCKDCEEAKIYIDKANYSHSINDFRDVFYNMFQVCKEDLRDVMHAVFQALNGFPLGYDTYKILRSINGFHGNRGLWLMENDKEVYYSE